MRLKSDVFIIKKTQPKQTNPKYFSLEENFSSIFSTPITIVGDVWSEFPVCQTQKGPWEVFFLSKLPIIIILWRLFAVFSATLLLFPFFVLIFRCSLRKHYEENRTFFLSSCFNGWAKSNQQILQFLYGASSLIDPSLLWTVWNKIGIGFLSWNSKTDRKIKCIRDKIREIIFKYLFCLNSDTWEERNWATNFSK